MIAPLTVLANWANDTKCPLDEANVRAAAYAAVVELIESDKAVDEVHKKINSYLRAGPRKDSYDTGWALRDEAYKRALQQELDAAFERRDVALKNVQEGAK